MALSEGLRIRRLGGLVAFDAVIARDRAVSDRPLYGFGRYDLHEIHGTLCLIRAADERIELLHREGYISGDIRHLLGREAGARSVDDTDVLVVFSALREAAALARAGESARMV